MRGHGRRSELFTALWILTATAIITSMMATGCMERERDDRLIKVATFEADATPPIGSPLAYDPTERIDQPLTARGVVLIGDDGPIVLVAVDWIGIYNEPNNLWRKTLAEVAGTTPERVTIHMLHQHDAPRADFTTAEILSEYGILQGSSYDNLEFVEQTIKRTADALREAIEHNLQTITHVGTGTGVVDKIASTRRVLNRKGRVRLVRYTSGATNLEAREAPVGTIDPEVKLLTFWHEDKPVVALSYYATHPQSYYRTGAANPDFPGIARASRDDDTGVMHIHFTGAGGNVGAGKWNDGSPGMRPILADRLAKGMDRAWEQTVRTAVNVDQLEWRVEPVALPPRENLNEQELEQILSEGTAENHERAARELAFLRRYHAGEKIRLTALRVGPARVLHTPGELAVEYQLEAQSLYPDAFIANASYTYMAAGYISTEIQYTQGGYEDSERASRVAPEVDHVLRPAIRKVLAFDAFQPDPEELEILGYRLERSAVQRGFDGEHSWIYGRAGILPPGISPNPIVKPTVILTTHELDYSDNDIVKGLHIFRSRDLGLTWEGPFEEAAFRREAVDEKENLDRLVSGFTPKYHDVTQTLLGIGHTVHYEENRIKSFQNRQIVYATFNPTTQMWSERQILRMPDDTRLTNAGAGSVQRVDLEDGTILLPVYFNEPGSDQCNVMVVRFSFDGDKLEYIEHGNVMTVEDVGSGLLGPSLAEFDGNYYLTLHNEEDAYVARSEDGLHFGTLRSWTFDDGAPLDGGIVTQQWVSHSDGLYLAYTRPQDPVFLVQVEPIDLQLIEQTKQAIIPVQNDARLDHIDVTHVSEDETWVIATEYMQLDAGERYAGNNMIHVAQLNWLESNERYRR